MARKSDLNKFIENLTAFHQQYLESKNSADIQRLVAATEEAQVLQAVEQIAARQEDKLITFVKAICLGLSGETAASRAKRKKLIRTLLDLLRVGGLERHVASGLLCIIFTEVDFLNTTEILDLLRDYKRAIERGIGNEVGERYIDGFTKLLHALDNLPNGDDVGDHISPTEMKEKFLKEFCQPHREPENGAVSDDEGRSAKWHPTSVLHVLMAFKDAMLTAEQLKWTISKTVALLPQIDFDDLPNVIYELIALAKGPERSLVLSGICDFFTDNDKKQSEDHNEPDSAASAKEWETLKRCEGFVILHVMFAVRQSHETGRILLNVLKSKGHDLFLPFNFGLLLAVTQVGNRIKDQFLDLGKTTVLQYLKIAEKQEKSIWIRSRLRFDIDWEKLIKEVAETSQVELGWEYSVLGMRELGFLLLETHLPKLIILGSGKLAPESPSAAGYNACVLGKSMLYKCFVAYNQEMRRTVIKRIFDLITIPSLGGRNSALFFIEVLSGLVARGISAFTSSDELILEHFELLPSIQSDIVVPFMKALLPVVKLKATLRDGLIMVLKKALFSRDTEARRTAVSGFLMFLKHFKILNAFQQPNNDSNRSLYYHSFPTFGSQVLSETKSDPQKATYERLCLEVIGCLRRTLSLQGELKEVLYHGLLSVVRRNESTLQPALELLYRHFQDHLVEPDVMPPFKLKECVQETGKDTVTVMDSFGWLISSMTRMLKQAEDDKQRLRVGELDNNGDGNSSQASELYFNYDSAVKIRGVIAMLAKRVSEAELEDFSIDKSADFSPSPAGERNMQLARQLLSAYEALIGFMATFFDFTMESTDIILNLHNQYSELKRLIQEKSTTKGKKATVASGAVTAVVVKAKPFTSTGKAESIDVSCLDLSALLDLCNVLLRDQSPSRREGLEPLRQSDEFICWLFGMALAKIKHMSTRRKADTSKTFETICKLSALMHQFYAEGTNIVVEMKRAKLKHLKLVALDIVGAVLEVVNQQFLDRFQEAVQIWSGGLDPRSHTLPQCSLNSNLAAYGRAFQRHLKDLLVKRAEIAAAPRRNAGRHDDSDDDPLDELSVGHLTKLIAIIDGLWKHLPPSSDQLKTEYEFLLRLCKEQAINDAVVAKGVWNTLLQMHHRMDGTGNLPLVLAKNLRLVLGNLDPAVEIVADPDVVYSSVVSRTSTVITAVLIQSFDEWREDCSFVIDHIRQNAMSAKNNKDSAWTPNGELDDAVSDHLHELAVVWLELVASSLPDAHIQKAAKSLRSLFDTFAALMRYYTLLIQSKFGTLTPKFVDFANFVAKDLMATAYKFISYAKCTAAEPVGKKKSETAARNQAMREMKDMSDLIYALSTFEKCLIDLSRKAKNTKLVERMYLGHNRDFRLDYDRIARAFANDKNGDDDGDEMDDNDSTGLSNRHENGTVANISRATGTKSGAAVKRKSSNAVNGEKRKKLLE